MKRAIPADESIDPHARTWDRPAQGLVPLTITQAFDVPQCLPD